MTDFDAIVIGAGINGLVAGATLARRGKRVCILDQRDGPGGMATLSRDGGPPLAHLLYNLSPTALKGIGLNAAARPFATDPLPSVALSPGGDHVVLHGHKATLPDGTPHPQAAQAEALLTRLTDYAAILRRLGEAPPPGGAALMSTAMLRQVGRLAQVGWGAKGLGKAGIRRFLQVLLSNAQDLILDELTDGPLAGLLAADAVRGAAAGPRSPGTVFNLIYRLGHGGTVRLPEGGMGAAIDAIASAARQAGCQIRTGQTVTRITVQDDAASGVALSDGSHLSARTVLVSAGPRAALDLAGAAPFDIEAARRIRGVRARGTIAKVNMRLRAPVAIPGLPAPLTRARLVLAPSVTAVERAFNPSKYGEMSETPVIEAVQMEAGGAPWLSAIVQYAPSDLSGGWTEAATARLARITVDSLALVMPDLPSLVEDTQVFTPDRIAAATGAPGGHWHHAEMALDQVLTLRPAVQLSRYAIGPKGLYLCGAATHPGGDVMGLAGRNAALAVLEGGL